MGSIGGHLLRLSFSISSVLEKQTRNLGKLFKNLTYEISAITGISLHSLLCTRACEAAKTAGGKFFPAIMAGNSFHVETDSVSTQAYHILPSKSKESKRKIKIVLGCILPIRGYHCGMNVADMTTADLLASVGGLSKPSKMPGYAYGLSANLCKVGSLLRRVKNSTCGSCYALKGMYVFPVVKQAHARRLEKISDPLWVAYMTELISRKSKKVPYFRWHDSGDLQSVEHLSKIVQIANNLPGINFWLPTREMAMVKEFLAGNKFPANLNVRVSAPMIGRAPEKISGTTGSSVDNPSAFQCPAPKQGNSCLDCRACWLKKVPEVSYSKH